MLLMFTMHRSPVTKLCSRAHKTGLQHNAVCRSTGFCGLFSLCKYRFQNCFLFWCLLKCGNQHRKKKEWPEPRGVAWARQPQTLTPPNSAVLKRPLYANPHELPSSKQSTGVTFNYKINMDFLINTPSVCVYRNGALRVSTALTELGPFCCQSLHIKNLLLLRKKKKKWPSEPHGVNQ